MIPSRKFWEDRADRLFREWDSIEDPYGLPPAEFYKAAGKVNEACTISMMLQSLRPQEQVNA